MIDGRRQRDPGLEFGTAICGTETVSISPDELRERIRTVPNWPVDGVQFRDITPVLADGDAFRRLIAELHARHAADPPDGVAAVDARGFIIGGALACALGVGFVPVRKRGKLPYRTLAEDYALEYGSGTLEVHADGFVAGQKVLLVDDLVATGGTLLAAARLLQRLGAQVTEALVMVELPELGGRRRLTEAGVALHALVSFEGH